MADINEETIVEEGCDIYKIDTVSDGLRNSGYKNIYNAIAEIVDNSIEAGAKNVLIIGKEGLVANGSGVISYGFLDDGCGMDNDLLARCLQVGYSSRRARKGMGRFGVGLPQASFYASPRVEVYSWTNGIENCKCVYIDLEEVSAGKETKIRGPFISDVPEDYKKFLNPNLKLNEKNYDFSKHGTLVVWPKVDKQDFRRWNTLVDHLSFDLGRKYRWIINDENVDIEIVKQCDFSSSKVLVNDPLYLMDKSITCVKKDCGPGNYDCGSYNEKDGFTEHLFEPYTTEENDSGIVEQHVKYYNKKREICEGIVTLRFSIVKEQFYGDTCFPGKTNPGSSPFGKAISKNAKISVVRKGREIDFNTFGFFDSQSDGPIDRWWGCEIDFDPDMDEAFGVSSNKQQVELSRIDDDSLEEHSDDLVPPMWLQLYKPIHETIKKMRDRNAKLRKDARTDKVKPAIISDLSETITKAEENNDDLKVTIPSTPFQITEDVKTEVTKELVEEGFLNESEVASEEQAKAFVQSKVRIKIMHSGERGLFVDYSESLGVLIIMINEDHPFYERYAKEAFENEDMSLSFKLYLAAFVKTAYEISITNSKTANLFVKKFNDKLTAYMEEV